MKVRTSIIAVGAAAVLGTTGTLLVPAMASANSATHTLKFISVATKSVMFTKTSGASTATDVSAAGKTVGFDMIYFKATSATSAAVNVTVDTKGGFLYGTGTINIRTNAFTNGKVTGGTGTFKGATGTIKAKAISSKKEAVTITYRS